MDSAIGVESQDTGKIDRPRAMRRILDMNSADLRVLVMESSKRQMTSLADVAAGAANIGTPLGERVHQGNRDTIIVNHTSLPSRTSQKKMLSIKPSELTCLLGDLLVSFWCS
jgi:hypothetical protein